MRSFGPARIDPAGAPSPFERQNISVSAEAAISRTGIPSAAAALKIRAPSMCTRTPRSCAPSQISRTVRIG
jgi:hypothetical protein